jgi:SNF2 family DNA or RNA helicase
MYRALYLDKLLEKNEEIYSSRDSYFREMVKDFKTLNDGEFEEPPSLVGIMRGYQRTGYRWLRTLEAYHLGGILGQ